MMLELEEQEALLLIVALQEYELSVLPSVERQITTHRNAVEKARARATLLRHRIVEGLQRPAAEPAKLT